MKEQVRNRNLMQRETIQVIRYGTYERDRDLIDTDKLVRWMNRDFFG